MEEDKEEMDNTALPAEIIDIILRMANKNDTREDRSILDFVEDTVTKSHFKTPFMREAYNALKRHNVWLALKCWLMTKKSSSEFPQFDFEISIHNEERSIHLDSVTVDRNPMRNCGNVNNFFIGDAHVFLFNNVPGVTYKQQVYKICAIYIPGYKKSVKNGMSFRQPKEDDVLKIRVHWFMECKTKLFTNDMSDSE